MPSCDAIRLTIFGLVQQRLEGDIQKREAEADLKNDALAAEYSEKTSKMLERILSRLPDDEARPRE
mgnify:FL=1